MSEVRTLRAKKAATKRHRPDADTTELDRDLKAAKLEAYIKQVVDQAPPLTPEQLSKLSALLAPGIAAVRSSEGGETAA